ncbi:MAG: IS21-like element helper ATPase IstB [Mariprofundaceae bacterium]|nr:IS21-like element helper ATPase IstB [Mariprofundaceae bacterium]
MNKNQTVEKLNNMRLGAMASMHQHNMQNNLYNDTTPDEYIAILADHEWEDRQSRKIQRLIAAASFRQNASIADVDFATIRNLDKNMFNRLSSLSFIQKRENIILTGSSGVGKSYLAQALGNHACQMGLKTQYHITSRLFNRLKLSKVDGTYGKELKKLKNIDLLILDDFGLQAFDNHAREALMDIIEDRFNLKSTIMSSQIPVSSWYDIIGEGTIADAVLDRIVNSSHRIDLKGESLRKGILKQEN